MSEAMMMITMASFGLIALSISLFAGLKGWHEWLEVKRMELAGPSRREPRGPTADLIEIADLKERVRKLESIAACIDL